MTKSTTNTYSTNWDCFSPLVAWLISHPKSEDKLILHSKQALEDDRNKMAKMGMKIAELNQKLKDRIK